MSVLFRRIEERQYVIPPYDLARIMTADYGYRAAGVAVDTESAMRHDAVWACITRIAQDVSMMPADVVRYRADGTREEVTPAPQIIAKPSVNVAAMDWRYQIIVSWLTAGNAWGLVTQTNGNVSYPTRIELIPPGKVRVQQNGNKVEFYVAEIKHDLWPLGDLWHVPAFTMPGQLLGLSPIANHALAIGIGLASAKFGGDWFNDGGHPSAIVGVEGTPTEQQASDLKQKLLNITRGNRELLVMSKSTSYTPLQVNPEESQFLNTMRYSVEQVCRIFGEDPADYGSSGGGTSVTYANRSDADLARFKRRQFWVTKLQNALTDILPAPLVVRLNTSSTLMMTDKERWDILDLRLKNKTMTINDARKLEDEKPFADPIFDQPGVPGGQDSLAQTANAEIERQALLLQKIYLAVGVVVTVEEARELAIKAGMDLQPFDPALFPAKSAPAPFGGGNP